MIVSKVDGCGYQYEARGALKAFVVSAMKHDLGAAHARAVKHHQQRAKQAVASLNETRHLFAAQVSTALLRT